MRSATHIVLIPSYNPGPKVYETVSEALRHWAPVWVVVDGSTDGTAQGLTAMAREHPGLVVINEAQTAARGPRYSPVSSERGPKAIRTSCAWTPMASTPRH